MIKHKFTSPKSDPADATLVRPSAWNDDHLYTEGADGQVPVYDAASPHGATWGWRANGTPFTALAQIPLGTIGFAVIPDGGSRKIGWWWNDGGNYVEIISITE